MPVFDAENFWRNIASRSSMIIKGGTRETRGHPGADTFQTDPPLPYFPCRYLLRTVKHPILLKDPDVLQFLESSEVNGAPANGIILKTGSHLMNMDRVLAHVLKLWSQRTRLVFHL